MSENIQSMEHVWNNCLERLQDELPESHFNMWIRPLKFSYNQNKWIVFAPNKFVRDWVDMEYLSKISYHLEELTGKETNIALVESGFSEAVEKKEMAPIEPAKKRRQSYSIELNPNFTIKHFVSGKSNQLAVAAAKQIVLNPGTSYNPLFIYGGVGLGKTHLMQAVGNALKEKNPNARVVYLSSERYVSEMVRAIQTNSMESFKEFYRTCDLLLIDDIQFFAGKDRSQEEFFHTFNELLEGRQQMIFTCDRYPREIDGLEDRLKSRFGWGLTVAVEPPELETRVAILIHKAELAQISIPHEVAFFIAKRMHSNVRELEGALKRVIAHIQFTGEEICLEVVKEALKDLIALQDRLITIDNIKKTVAEYYKIREVDLIAVRRTRTVARPRQLAMALAKELTNHSLPEIGSAFGGRDHTTVLHACRKVKELLQSDKLLSEDYLNLKRTLNG